LVYSNIRGEYLESIVRTIALLRGVELVSGENTIVEDVIQGQLLEYSIRAKRNPQAEVHTT
jgi:hypothetical protein